MVRRADDRGITEIHCSLVERSCSAEQRYEHERTNQSFATHRNGVCPSTSDALHPPIHSMILLWWSVQSYR